MLHIQFHNFVPNCAERRAKIQENLEKLGYSCMFNFKWVWELWIL